MFCSVCLFELIHMYRDFEQRRWKKALNFAQAARDRYWLITYLIMLHQERVQEDYSSRLNILFWTLPIFLSFFKQFFKTLMLYIPCTVWWLVCRTKFSALNIFFTRYQFCTMFRHTTLCHKQGVFVVGIITFTNGPLYDKLNSQWFTSRKLSFGRSNGQIFLLRWSRSLI